MQSKSSGSSGVCAASSILLAILILFVALPAAALAQAAPVAEAPTKPALTGRLETIGGQRTLFLWGAPEERGFAHGYLLGKTIIKCIEADFGGYIGAMGGDTRMYENMLLKRVITNFVFTPGEVQMMEGMLKGMAAAIPDPEQRKLKLLGRELGLADLKAINTVGDWMALGCSTVILPAKMTESGETIAVRNFDFPALSALSTESFVVVCDPAEPGAKAYIGVGHPGGIGVLSVMNEAGVFLAVHDVPVKPGLRHALMKNTPRLMALERLARELEPETAFEVAGKRLAGWRSLYGNNIAIARNSGPSVGAIFEWDRREGIDDGVTRRDQGALESPLMCTNHHRKRGIGGEDGREVSSCWRYALLSERAGDADARMDRAACEELMDLAAFPSEGRPLSAGGLGTLHQCIAHLGQGVLWVRSCKVGESITKREGHAFRLAETFGSIPGYTPYQSSKR